jgi:hypothetical protein
MSQLLNPPINLIELTHATLDTASEVKRSQKLLLLPSNLLQSFHDGQTKPTKLTTSIANKPSTN